MARNFRHRCVPYRPLITAQVVVSFHPDEFRRYTGGLCERPDRPRASPGRASKAARRCLKALSGCSHICSRPSDMWTIATACADPLWLPACMPPFAGTLFHFLLNCIDVRSAAMNSASRRAVAGRVNCFRNCARRPPRLTKFWSGPSSLVFCTGLGHRSCLSVDG